MTGTMKTKPKGFNSGYSRKNEQRAADALTEQQGGRWVTELNERRDNRADGVHKNQHRVVRDDGAFACVMGDFNTNDLTAVARHVVTTQFEVATKALVGMSA